MKILLSGFMPFLDNKKNVSFEVLKELKKQNDSIEIIELPVIYGEEFVVLEDRIRMFKPNIVCCFGLAKSRKKITPELVAINYRFSKQEDNKGQKFNGRLIDENGSKAFFTKIDISSLVQSLNDEGIPSDISLFAGAYVCNDLYYHLLKNEEKYGYKGLFVHLPDSSDMPFTDILKGVEIINRELEKQK